MAVTARKLYEAEGKNVTTLAELEDLLQEFKNDYEKGQKLPAVKSSPPDSSVFDIKLNDKYLCGVLRNVDKTLRFSLQEQPKPTVQDMADNIIVYETIDLTWSNWIQTNGHTLDAQRIAADAMNEVKDQLIQVYPDFVPLMKAVVLFPLPTDSGTLGVSKYNPTVSRGVSQVLFVYNPWFVTRYMVSDFLAKKSRTCEQALMFTILHELSHVFRNHLTQDSRDYFSGVTHTTENAIMDVGINNFCMKVLNQPCGDSFLSSGVYVDMVVGNDKASAKGVITQLESLLTLFLSDDLKRKDVSVLQEIKPTDRVRIILGSKIEDTSQILGTIGNMVKYGFAVESKNVHDAVKAKIEKGDVNAPDLPGMPSFQPGDIVLHVPTRSIYVILEKYRDKRYYSAVRIGSVADVRILIEISNDPNFGPIVASKTSLKNQNVYEVKPQDLIPIKNALDLHPQKIITPGKLVVGPDGKICRVVSTKGASSVELDPLTKEELEKVNSTIRSDPKGYLEKLVFGKAITPKNETLKNQKPKVPAVEDYVPPFVRLREKDGALQDTDGSFGSDFAGNSNENLALEELSFEAPSEPSLTDYRYVGKKILDSDF